MYVADIMFSIHNIGHCLVFIVLNLDAFFLCGLTSLMAQKLKITSLCLLEDDLLKVVNSFYRRPEVKCLAAEHGLDS